MATLPASLSYPAGFVLGSDYLSNLTPNLTPKPVDSAG